VTLFHNGNLAVQTRVSGLFSLLKNKKVSKINESRFKITVEYSKWMDK